MKILLINPNTSADITARVVSEARRHVSPGVEVVGSTGRFGARYIMTRAASAIAGHAALDAYAVDGADADAIVLACFGDPGLAALKEVARQPVVGMAEASCLMAAATGRRFAIVTGGAAWRPMLEEFVAALGLASRLAAVLTVAPSGAEIAADPDRALAALADAANACATDHGADTVILGGAGLAGLAERLAPSVRVPLIDSVAAAVAMAEARFRLSGAGRFLPVSGASVETTGLGPQLRAHLMGKDRDPD